MGLTTAGGVVHGEIGTTCEPRRAGNLQAVVRAGVGRALRVGRVPVPLGRPGRPGSALSLAAPRAVGEVGKRLVGGRELGFDVFGLVDDQLLEDGLVDEAFGALREAFVGDDVVVEKFEGVVEGLHDVVDLVSGGVCPSFGFGALALDALLLCFEDV
ncbi:MAG TPA: hypothetical protein VFW29_02990, partial [Solirubrobacteraceae bacterium]|nr:hypothetical protein [Solirubrobacteraceae bacterium]